MKRNGYFLYEYVNNGIRVNSKRSCILMKYDGPDQGVLKLPSVINGEEVVAVDKGFWNNLPDFRQITIAASIRNICLEARNFKSFIEPNRAHLNKLQNISVARANKVYHSVDGVLYINGPSEPDKGSVLYLYPTCRPANWMRIEDGCTKIFEHAFMNSVQLKQIFASNVKEIGRGAFEGCENVSTLEIGRAMTIGNGAFKGCSSLIELNLASVQSLDGCSFSGCSNLIRITIGDKLELYPYMFSSCSPATELVFEGEAMRRYATYRRMIFSFESSGIRLVCCLDSPSDGLVEIPASVKEFSSDVFRKVKGITTVKYGSGTKLRGDDIPGKTFIQDESVPDFDNIIRNKDYILYIPAKEISILYLETEKGFGPLAFSKCQKIGKLVVGDNMRINDLAGLFASVKVDQTEFISGPVMKPCNGMLLDRKDKFVCRMAGNVCNTLICKGLSPFIVGMCHGIEVLVIDMEHINSSIPRLSSFPDLKWLFIRTTKEISCSIPVKGGIHTVVFRDYQTREFVGDKILVARTGRREIQIDNVNNQMGLGIVCIDYERGKMQETFNTVSASQILTKIPNLDRELMSMLSSYVRPSDMQSPLPVDIQNSKKEKSEDVTPGKKDFQASEEIKKPDRKTINRRVVVPLRHIIIVTQKFRCIREGHTLEDITIKVRMLAGSGLSVIDLPAGYCRECGSYYVYSSVFDELIGSRMRPGVEILQNRFKMPDGRFYGSIYETTGTLQSESLLKRCGYTVGITAGLSDRARITLLKQIMDMELMTRQEVMSYLNYFISFNGRKSGNEIAKMQWEKDLITISRN